MQIYNSLTRQKEPFQPLNPEHVTIYVCGPTVYSYAHIGNARPAVVFDVLARLMRVLYKRVTFVRNITDIDDKINAAAAAAGVEIGEDKDVRFAGNGTSRVLPLGHRGHDSSIKLHLAVEGESGSLLTSDPERLSHLIHSGVVRASPGREGEKGNLRFVAERLHGVGGGESDAGCLHGSGEWRGGNEGREK